MHKWVEAAKEGDLKKILPVTVSNRKIVLFRLSDGIYALDNICSHEYALLSDGEVWDELVYCPKHGSSFNIKTGAVDGLPATLPVTAYSVKIENGSIYIKEKEASR